jgi:hypothetical protein
MDSTDDLESANCSVARRAGEDGFTLIIGQTKVLPAGVQRRTVYFENVQAVKIYLEREPAVIDHLKGTKGLFYLIIIATFAVALAFISAGLGLVYLGATGNSEVTLLGLKMTSTNTGIVSIAFGALVTIAVWRSAMRRIQGILEISPRGVKN